MEIKVLLFGPQAELAETTKLMVEIKNSPANVRAVMDAIALASPPLKPTLASSRLAINHGYASDADAIVPSDEVALIGMVSGG